MLAEWEQPDGPAVRFDRQSTGAEQIDGPVPFEMFYLKFKPSRKSDVVGVHSGDVFAACTLNDLIQPRSEPTSRAVPQQDDSGITDCANLFGRSVVRTIVDDNQLPVAERLADDRPY